MHESRLMGGVRRALVGVGAVFGVALLSAGVASAAWVFNSAGQIESVAFPGDCVSISDAADDTPVILLPCQTNANNQRWNPQTNGQVTSALGPCLNVFGGVAQPGTPVIAYHCTADVADEEWDSVP